MGLNDEREKLKQAKDWLVNCGITSQQFKAAWDHVTFVHDNTADQALKDEAWRIMNGVREKAFGRNHLN